MLGTKPRPMIGKLSDLLISSKKPGFLDVGTSPRSPLDHFKSPSPRGLTRFDVGGVGLGIVTALEKSSYSDSCNSHAICSSNLNRSNGIGVDSVKDYDSLDVESSEEFTYVTRCHGNGMSSTKVYYDGGEDDEERRFSSGLDRIGFDAFKETPTARFEENVSYPTLNFLSSCYLCRKKLHGKDIYMYRGEKGFCSSECRSTQIMMAERKEQCRSSRSAKVQPRHVIIITIIQAKSSQPGFLQFSLLAIRL